MHIHTYISILIFIILRFCSLYRMSREYWMIYRWLFPHLLSPLPSASCFSFSGQKWPTKKYRNFMFEVLDVLFLKLKPFHVAYASFMEAWWTSKLQFLIKKLTFFSAVNFFLRFLAIKPLDPDLQLEKMVDPVRIKSMQIRIFLNPSGEGGVRSQIIIQRRESLVLYKWFITLCSM